MAIPLLSTLTVVVNDLSFSATPVFSATATKQSMTLTGNVTSSTLAAGINGFETRLILKQDATGGWTFAWPSNVQGPTIGSSANQRTLITLVYHTADALWLTCSAVTLG